jgi:hypothetical protein
MNRSLPLRPGLLLVAALSLGLAGCGQGLGPGLASPTPDPPVTPDVTVSEDGEQTLEEVTDGPTPEVEPPATEEPPEPTITMVTLTLLPVLPAAEDCVSYNPANLTVTASGDAWLLRDGDHAMKLFDTAAEAEDARRVARNWSRLCFIGRGGSGPDRYRHIINYFKEPSGLPLGVAPATIDCITYDPDDLDLYEGPAHPAEPDHNYWSLYSGPTPLLELDNQADAMRAEIVASGYTRLCFIGAGNDRPDPYRYQMEWWRA